MPFNFFYFTVLYFYEKKKSLVNIYEQWGFEVPQTIKGPKVLVKKWLNVPDL